LKPNKLPQVVKRVNCVVRYPVRFVAGSLASLAKVFAICVRPSYGILGTVYCMKSLPFHSIFSAFHRT